MDTRILVTITDNVSASSMPYNEFVLYRKKNLKDEKQILILLFKDKISPDVSIPSDLEFYIVGNKKKELKQIIYAIVNKAKKLKNKVVFHIHEAKSVVFFNLATGFRYKKNIVYTLHSTYKNYPLHNKLLARIASLQCKIVVCVSKTSFRYYPKDIKLIRNKNIRCIQNGVDLDRIDSIQSREKSGNDSYIMLIYVARMRASKRHDLLLEAIKQVDGVRLSLVGTGMLEDELKEKTKLLGIAERVEFCGQLPRDDVYGKLKESDVYISASTYEGLPIGVLEAMGSGLPCVLSNIEQHREIYESCSHLVLVDNNIDAWVSALSDINGITRDKLRLIGSSNRDDAEAFFSLKKMHAGYTELYKELG